MRILLIILLVAVAISENPLRDKVRIASCEDSNGQPEMTIVGPDIILNGNGIKQTGRIIEKKIGREHFTMTTNDKSEFKNF